MSSINELRRLRGSRRGSRQENKVAFFFLLPWFVGLFGITLGPVLASLYLSFTKYNLLQPPQFSGVDNWTRVRGLAFYRSVFHLPSLIGGSVAIAVLWRTIFGTSGLVNKGLGLFGIHGQDWIPEPSTCETLWYRPDEYFDVPRRALWDVEGGGPTMGHGIRHFDLMLSVLAPWSQITALADRRARPTDTEDVSVAAVRFAGGALATVVNSLQPDTVQLESPKPYIHPLRTRAGKMVSLLRPHDHVWHKGIAWSLPHIGEGNFWGGPTYIHGRFYVQRENNGTRAHRQIVALNRSYGTATFAHDLDWITPSGKLFFTERRTPRANLISPHAWALTFETRMTNVSGSDVAMGSPTTKRRENAGYGGLFWRYGVGIADADAGAAPALADAVRQILARSDATTAAGEPA